MKKRKIGEEVEVHEELLDKKRICGEMEIGVGLGITWERRRHAILVNHLQNTRY